MLEEPQESGYDNWFEWIQGFQIKVYQQDKLKISGFQNKSLLQTYDGGHKIV